MRVAPQSLRAFIFRVSLLTSAIAIVMVPFYEHWFSKLGYAALASDTLHVWLDSGMTVSVIALLGSLFGRGPRRVIAFFLSVVEFYFWFVLSIAV